MTYLECIQYVDSIEPNAYTTEQKTRWVLDCEGKVFTEIFLQQPLDLDYTGSDVWDNDLALPAPYDRVYKEYLQARIHYSNGEYDRYSASMQMFNQAWHDLVVWFGQDFDITDRVRNHRITIPVGVPDTAIKLLTIPERHALIAGRIVVKKPFTNEDEDDVYGYFWIGDRGNDVGNEVLFSERGSRSLMVIVGDVGGTDVGLVLDEESATGSGGEAFFTGVLCVPDEEFPPYKLTGTTSPVT